VLDVDGVLTDGTVWWGPGGEETKRFSFLDIMGVARARRDGVRFGLISGEFGPPLEKFASKTGITDIAAPCTDKAGALREFSVRQQIRLDEICYVGDDVNDLEAMSIAGLAIAPANGHPRARAAAALVTASAGGAGAVRELIDALAAAGRIVVPSLTGA